MNIAKIQVYLLLFLTSDGPSPDVWILSKFKGHKMIEQKTWNLH